MVHHSTSVDRAFAALGDPTRRAVLERLGSGSATISELAEPFDMSLTGMKKHIRLLEEAVQAALAKMAPGDRAIGKRIHAIVKKAAPELRPKTWYGMPAYANADGKVVVFFQDSGKFKYRYSTLGFQEAANLDEGDMWPVAYALTKWSPLVEKKVTELVKAAIS